MSISDLPRDEAFEVDPLSLTLASLSWPSWRAGVAYFDESWGAEVPEGLVSFYAVRTGQCTFSAADLQTVVEVEAGDLLLLPHGSAHRLQDQLASPVRDYRDVFQRYGYQGMPAETTLVYGHFAMQGPDLNPLHRHLSSFLHLKQRDFDQLQEVEALFDVIDQEQRTMRPGWQAIVNQLVQVLFHQSLRAFVCRNQANGVEGPQEQIVSDPVIGLVVGLLSSQMETPWTVASLARWVNMSRSAFSERFRDVMGKPPLQYLTELRMQRACELLIQSDLGVRQIATMVGYESPSSFTNAFKRWNEVSPATYRTRHAG